MLFDIYRLMRYLSGINAPERWKICSVFSERNMCFLECRLIVSLEPLTEMLKFGILQIRMTNRTSSRQSEQRQKRNRQLLA